MVFRTSEKRFKYKGVKTVKEKLTSEQIQRIVDLQLEEGSLIWHVKNYFMFSYYCAGIRAGDLIQLRWSNITEGDNGNKRLEYQMGKNHKGRDFTLVEPALEILKLYYREGVKPSDYIFPLLDNDAPWAKFLTLADKDRMKPELRHQLYQQISAKNALINKYLKKIAEKAEITTNLTFHVSRHSFARLAQSKGAQAGAVQSIMGHSNLGTTERYMGEFSTEVADEMLNNLFKEPKSLSKSEKAQELDARLEGYTEEQIDFLMALIASKK